MVINHLSGMILQVGFHFFISGFCYNRNVQLVDRWHEWEPCRYGVGAWGEKQVGCCTRRILALVGSRYSAVPSLILMMMTMMMVMVTAYFCYLYTIYNYCVCCHCQWCLPVMQNRGNFWQQYLHWPRVDPHQRQRAKGKLSCHRWGRRPPKQKKETCTAFTWLFDVGWGTHSCGPWIKFRICELNH